MLAWQHPYCNRTNFEAMDAERYWFLLWKLVGEATFVRIAPAVSCVADWSTSHKLFNALAHDREGMSYGLWSTYINELLKIHGHRKSYPFPEFSRPFTEKILCLSSSRKPPVLKWENNMVWPGKVTLTDEALYFEGINLEGQKDVMRLDLTKEGTQVMKTRVGPLGSDLFDSAIFVSSGPENSYFL